MIAEQLHNQTASQFAALGLENDPELREIIDTASSATETPFAVISFVENETTYFKLTKGFDAASAPGELSFCNDVAGHDGLMEVGDTLSDSRFAGNADFFGEASLRFFAGVPLVSQTGIKIGALCVCDIIPRNLNKQQRLILEILARQIIKIVELKAGTELMQKQAQELAEQRRLNTDANIRLRSFFESSINFHVLLGKSGEVIDFNKTAYNFIRMVHKATLKRGDQFVKYIHPDFIPTFISQYGVALQGQRSLREGSTDYDEMGIIYWEAAFEPARDSSEEIIGVSYLIRNVTERKLKEQKILAQNASLLKIAHIQAHEFRAPLTSIMGLLGLIKEDDYASPREYIQLLEQAVEALDTTIRHIVKDIDDTVIPAYTADTM